jgi:enterochelin esterase family protein
MGSASVILDNLLAQGKMKPMIVVMPNAYWDEHAALDNAFPRTSQPPGVGSGRRDYDGNEQDIVDDLIPFVERHYRTLPGREHRALAGLSMGSGITANVGLERLEVFASIGIMSAGMFGNSTNPSAAPPEGAMLLEKISPGLVTNPAATNEKLKLFYFSCGVDDTRIKYFTKAVEDLRQRGVEAVLKTYPGAHEWRVWRSSLVDMAQLLFR